MLVSNDKVGVCDPGETMPEPNLLDLPEFNCSGLYYECRTDEHTSLQYWQRLEFVNGQVFNRYLNDSSETCKYWIPITVVVSKSLFLLIYVSFTAIISNKIYFKGADPDNCDGFDDKGVRWTVKRGNSITIPCTSGLVGN